ncbi:MAG TPA: carbohydrate ABC transporter permease [Streptosporangiaceae bacterium]|nr:carbohydrate ABC transporter permease [Streptosporangiaceae bacterium]
MSASSLSLPAARHRSVRVRGLLGRAVLGLFLTVAGVVMLLPVAWVVLMSFESTQDQTALPPVWFPAHLTLISYRTLFSAAPFAVNIINSVVITAAVVIGSAIVSILAAYAFARLEFRGREVVFTLFLAALTLPSQVSAVPEFVVVKYLHLLNSQLSLIIPALIQVVGVFLLRQHFRTIPTDLDDAARIDGAGHLKIIRHIMVPLSWPAISAVMVITGQYIWNDFFWPNLFINSTSHMPAPLALYNLEAVAGGGPIGAIFAGLSVLCVPCVIGFIILQRRLMEGIGYRGVSR